MSANGPVVLFWDIDGTLLTTARAGIIALERAFEDVTGKQVDLTDLASSGLTEHEVVQAVFAAAKVVCDDDLTDRLLRSYERHLPSSLPLREGRVLPGVLEILEDLAGRESVRNLLLTGNTPAGARAKLAHYGLLHFFTDGAYCTGRDSRLDIARRGARLADGARTVVVVGDTPHDITCGKAIGATTIAVATGTYDRDTLAQYTPSILLDALPEPAVFRRLAGLA